jgi:hypothetical protein
MSEYQDVQHICGYEELSAFNIKIIDTCMSKIVKYMKLCKKYSNMPDVICSPWAALPVWAVSGCPMTRGV